MQRRTYAEVNDLIESGDVDVAFVCTSAYVVGKREFDMQLLAAPQVMGDTVHHSLLIMLADRRRPNFPPAESCGGLPSMVCGQINAPD